MDTYKKKYKEANDKIAARFGTNVAKEIFTDLYESEDEKIRKALVNGFNKFDKSAVWYNGITNVQILVWLERQKEPKLSEDLGEYIAELSKQFPEVSFAKLSRIAVRVKNWLEKQGESIKIKKGKNYLCTKTHKYAGVEWIEGVKYYSPEDYSLVNQGCTCYCPKYSKEEHNNFFKEVEYDGCLEKQGEQRNKINSLKITFEDVLALECSMKTAKITEGGDKLYEILVPLYNKIHNAYLVEKQGEQKLPIEKLPEEMKTIGESLGFTTQEECDEYNKMVSDLIMSEDKVEPKFHEGDWIVQGSNILKIRCVGDEYYCYETVGGYVDDMLVSEIDSLYHLWTIQDAKDGDVLAVDSKPFIYNGSKNEVTVGAYCGFNSEHKFSFAYNYVINQNITPATKEQRELLFQKMKEEGYKWNNKNKELKKFHVIDEGKAEMDYCFTKMMNDEKVSYAWSEEDEAKLKSACALIRNTSLNGNEGIEDFTIDWLKSLKGRVQPQSKQKWSEEDEAHINSIIDYLLDYKLLVYEEDMNVANGVQKELDWLKSLQRMGG